MLLKLFGIIILLVLVFILVPILAAVFGLMGFFRRLNNNAQQNNTQGQWYNTGHQSQGNQQYSANTGSTRENVSGNPKARNSNIDKNEGEYVEFEEIN